MFLNKMIDDWLIDSAPERPSAWLKSLYIGLNGISEGIASSSSSSSCSSSSLFSSSVEAHDYSRIK